jgi:hypothetical protein
MKEDVEAILDIKEDVRTECSKIGEVTNVVLYDLEPEGVVTVKFAEPDDAQSCVTVCRVCPSIPLDISSRPLSTTAFPSLTILLYVCLSGIL